MPRRCRLEIVAAIAAAVALPPGVVADCPDPEPPHLLRIEDEHIGYMGATFAGDGQTVVLGDRNAYASATGGNPEGAAAVLRRNADGWAFEALLRPSGSTLFGANVTVSGDRVIVGALTSTPLRPVAYLYERRLVAGVPEWSLVTTQIFPGCGRSPASFYLSGNDLLMFPASGGCTTLLYHLSDDPTPTLVEVGPVPIASQAAEPPGSRMAFRGDVAAIGYADGQTFGRVEVFRRTAGVWNREAVLTGREESGRAGFGVAISLQDDVMAIGANWEPGLALTGYARVYRRDDQGQWNLEAEFEHPMAGQGNRNKGFGLGVCLRGDRLAIGSTKDDYSGPDSGAVFFYERVNGAWQPRASLSPADAVGAWTGWAVHLTDDGEAVAAAPGLDGRGGAVAFSSCSVSGDPGDSTPRCLPGAIGLLTFIEAFFRGDAFADYNRSGAVSVQDLFDYLAAWFAGCP